MEVEWISYYCCIRFPLDHPGKGSLEHTKIWRRNQREGPVDQRWRYLRLYPDEATGEPRIIELPWNTSHVQPNVSEHVTNRISSSLQTSVHTSVQTSTFVVRRQSLFSMVVVGKKGMDFGKDVFDFRWVFIIFV